MKTQHSQKMFKNLKGRYLYLYVLSIIILQKKKKKSNSPLVSDSHLLLQFLLILTEAQRV